MDREGGRGPVVEQSEAKLRAALESSVRTRFGDFVVHSGMRLRDIVKIFHAEEFIVQEGRGTRAYESFDFKAFTEREWAAGRHELMLPGRIRHNKEVVLPPGEGEIKRGDGSGFEEKDTIPRTKYLIDVLTELKIPYDIEDGEVTDEMVREQSYQVFILDGHHKLVFVNNEEGNATFIVYDVHAPKEEWRIYASFTKDELMSSQDVVRLIYTGEEDWKEKMRIFLSASHGLRRDKVEGASGLPQQRVDKEAGDWKNGRQLEREGLATYETIVKIIADLRVDHPTWCELRKGVGGRVTEHYSPELIAKLREILTERVEAPEGWKTLHEIWKKLRRDKDAILQALDRYLATRKDWKMPYLEHKTKVLRDHYAPELIEKLEEEFPEWKIPEPGWVNIVDLIARFARWRVSKHYLLDRLKEYEARYPDEAGLRKTPTMPREAMYCSEKCVSDLEKVLEETDRIQRTYISINDAMIKIPRGRGTLEKWAKGIVAVHPTWRTTIRRPEDGNKSVWYHPSLIAEMERLHRERPWISETKDQP